MTDAFTPDPCADYDEIGKTANIIDVPTSIGNVRFHQWGGGEKTLVCLHGGYGTWAHWIKVAPSLATFGNILVPDMPGFGASATPPEPHTAQGVAGPLREAIEKLAETGPIVVTGFSFGGVIAGHLASLLNRKLARLVLVAPGGLGAQRAPMAELVKRHKHMSRDEVVMAHQKNLEILMVKDPSCIDPLALYIQETNTLQHRLKSRPISATSTLRDVLSKVQAPVLGIFAEHDAVVGEYLQERKDILSEVCESVDFVVVPEAGHWVMWEKPQAMIGILRSVLEDLD